MRPFHSARCLLLALLFSLLPAFSHAQIAISVSFAPPELPIYEQPFCPQPNLIWTPGYWAYGDDDYYWVPGTWVPAPYEAALWTPPYWGWFGGRYRFHGGYWGRHVGYYGGVDYGYGYGGIGFSGGEWRGNEFAYNTAVMRVNESVIHTTYNDRTIVERNTIGARSRVSYNGGPGGVQHVATPEERVADRDQHTAPTKVQTQHQQTVRADKTSYAKANGGHPRTVVAAKPLGGETHTASTARTEARPEQRSAPARAKTEARAAERPAPARAKTEARPEERPAPARAKTEARPEERPAPARAKTEARPEERPAPARAKTEARPEERPAPARAKTEARPEERPAPARAKTEARPEQRSAPIAMAQAREAPAKRAAPQQHAVPQQHAAPQQHSTPKEESKPSRP